MKRNKTNLTLANSLIIANHSLSKVCKNNTLQNGFMEFDIFLFSNSFQEKLPIVYANIRV